jgi:hypothetical protein
LTTPNGSTDGENYIRDEDIPPPRMNGIYAGGIIDLRRVV